MFLATAFEGSRKGFSNFDATKMVLWGHDNFKGCSKNAKYWLVMGSNHVVQKATVSLVFGNCITGVLGCIYTAEQRCIIMVTSAGQNLPFVSLFTIWQNYCGPIKKVHVHKDWLLSGPDIFSWGQTTLWVTAIYFQLIISEWWVAPGTDWSEIWSSSPSNSCHAPWSNCLTFLKNVALFVHMKEPMGGLQFYG